MREIEMTNDLCEYMRAAGLDSALEPVDLYSVAGFAAEEGFDLSEYPQFADWVTRHQALPGFRPAKNLLPPESPKPSLAAGQHKLS